MCSVPHASFFSPTPVRYCKRCPNPVFGSAPPYRCINDHLDWDPPMPVAVAVVLVGRKVVLVRRAIEPGFGKWCLPGGFVARGEPIAVAAARELKEETAIAIASANFIYLWDAAVAEAGVNLVFMVTAWAEGLPLPMFVGDSEQTERAIFSPDALPTDMAFLTHVEAIHRAFALAA